MEDLKVRKVKNLDDVKKVFNFISSAIFNDVMKNSDEFIPLHELYETMIDTFVKSRELEFYGTVGKNVAGAVVSTVLPYDPKCLFVEIITVSENYRRNGVAQELLTELEEIATKKGFERMRVLYNTQAKPFFERNKFSLLLELAIPETLEIEDVIKINNLALKSSNILKYNNINFVQYNVSIADKRIKRYIMKNTPLVKANYIMEKVLKKN